MAVIAIPKSRAPAPERWWRYVLTGYGCWHWIGSTDRLGYGRFKLDGKATLTHRFAYELLVGPIPVGLEIDHICRNRRCVNPAHLEPVTHRENTLRGATLAAANARKTHCPQGHPFSDDNLVPSSLRRGKRDCKTCQQRRADELRRHA